MERLRGEANEALDQGDYAAVAELDASIRATVDPDGYVAAVAQRSAEKAALQAAVVHSGLNAVLDAVGSTIDRRTEERQAAEKELAATAMAVQSSDYSKQQKQLRDLEARRRQWQAGLPGVRCGCCFCARTHCVLCQPIYD